MDLDDLTSHLDVFTDHVGALDSLTEFFFSSAFKGIFVSLIDSSDGSDFFRTLRQNGSSFNSSQELSSNDLMGIWEGFSLYELPSSWRWMRLDQVGPIVGGGTPDTSNSTYWANDAGTPWVTPADMRGQTMYVLRGKRTLTDIGLRESSSKLLPSNSVVFSSRAPIGYVGITGAPLATNQGFKSCVPFMPEMAKYIYFYLMFIRSQINERATGTTFKEVSGKQFAATPIPVPPLNIQESIVEGLEEFSVATERAKDEIRQRAKLEDSARKSAVDALSKAQTPEEFQTAWERIQGNWDVIAGGPESIESLRELVLDVLFRPRNRDEWVTRSFGELLSLSNGDRSKNYPSKEHRVSTGIPFVNAGHLNNGRVNMSDMDYITREKYESLGGGKFKDGDVLFCLRGSLGKSALVRDVGEGAIASSLAILRVGGELDAEYLFWFLQSGMARVQIKNFDNGTAQPNLAAKNVLKFKLPLPPLNQQRNIVSRVGELIEICDQLEASMIEAEDIAHRFARSVVLSSS